MSITDLASELLLQIYRSCTSISDVVNLSLTCRRMHTLLPSSQKLSILFSAAEAEFGPLQDAIQLVTFTRHSTNIPRKPPLSYPLLRQVVFAGRIAERWTEMYQLEKWSGDNFLQRRTLTADERYRIRRAIYRYWLYTHAFHNADYLRTMRMFPPFVAERCQMLRQWSNTELIEIEDVRSVFRVVLAFHLCPDDGTVLQRRKDMYLPVFMERNRVHHSPMVAQSNAIDELFHSSRNVFSTEQNLSSQFISPAPLNPTTANRGLHMDGFGDEIDHYHFIESMSKLDPGQVIQLYDNAVFKWQIEDYVSSLGEWFPNNGQTWSNSWDMVLGQRGFNVQELRLAIEDGKLGVAVDDSKAGLSVEIHL